MLKLWWFSDDVNAGDYFSHYLLSKLGIDNCNSNDGCPDLIATGSILGFPKLKNHPKIWGSGFHNETDILHNSVDNIYAVRGKLSYNKLNINKHMPLGDPGLLASYVYKPKTEKRYDFGIVSHYVEEGDVRRMYPQYKVISMQTANIEQVLDEINECKFIFSSSLHGIIFAHSLGIPAIHVEHTPLWSKDNFKFKDYYSVYNSISYTRDEMISVDFNKYIIDDPSKYVPTKDEIIKIQKNLLAAFPFKELINENNNSKTTM